jgi:glucose/arabinose dehydrogenase
MSTKRRIRMRPIGALVFVLAAVLPLLTSSALAQSSDYELLVSLSPDRSSPTALAGQTVTGDIYVFTTPDAGVSQVKFYLDDPTMAGTPFLVEKRGPYDFAGTAGNGDAKPFDTGGISAGSHTITAVVVLSAGGQQVVEGTFTVEHAPELDFSASSMNLSSVEGGSVVSDTVELSASDGSAANVSLTSNAAWLSATEAGSTRTTVTVTADPTGLAVGTHTGAITASAPGYGSTDLSVTLEVTAAPADPPDYELLVSLSPDRSNPVPLEGQTVAGNIYAFTSPDTGASQVRFYLDDPTMAGSPKLTEKAAPYDFAGTASDGNAKPFDTKKITEASHTITAAIDLPGGGAQVVHGTFTVLQLPELKFSPTSLSFSRRQDASAVAQTVQLSADDSTAADTTVSTDAAWLNATAAGPTPTEVTITADPAGLSVGTHTGKVTASAEGYVMASLPVTLKVTSEEWCSDISPLPCSEVLVRFPYQLDFGSDAGKLSDANLIGTGFTMVDPPTKGTGYIADNLALDTQAGVLNITTTAGIGSGAVNSQDNALGVGIDAPDAISLLTTTLVAPPTGSGKYEQAGLWFGNDEDNHVKLIVRSTAQGTDIQYLLEVDGKQKNSLVSDKLTLAGSEVELSLRADPVTKGITGAYSIDGADPVRVGILRVPGEFFSADAAGIDPTIGTRTFGGIFATHRNASSPTTYTFDDFSLIDDSSGTAGGTTSQFSFDRTSFPLTRPSSMAWGPDGRLYVTEFLGTIHALTLGPDHQPVADEVITSLGSRLTLGIAVDPASTPSNVILWASHSDRNLTNDAPANSSVVSRLSGPGFTNREDVITGLPRSKANHSVNSLHFGPDGKLYVAVSGNTGAGAPNTADTEFGDRAEQPLAAAILIADVKSPDFQGNCATPLDTFGFPETCDVRPYATGFRNTYDFVFHSNGSMYATENGLGVEGSFPPSPTPTCTGLASTEPWNAGGHNPGEQPDFLYRVEQGKYHGHPNPYRDECVFKDGRYQDVAPLPNYAPPIFNLGSKKSANGVIEYKSDAFKGSLKGDLLIVNYSQGDDVVRAKLSPDGLSVVDFDLVAGGFSDPLPLIEGPGGTIFVGEFGSSQITVLKPRSMGRWEARVALPDAILDAGGTALGGKIYSVAGKTSSGHLKTMHVYDVASDSWSVGPSLPAAYAAVENPAAVALDGKLYLFGGSTDAFSGAVASAAVFDPATSEWTMLSSMPTARGGAVAEAMGGKIYVAGGMDGSGASLASVEVYNPATDTWSSAAPMQVRRDNPGSAVLDGRLYTFGGRTRNADGTTLNGTLSSVEMYDSATDTWIARAPMPTGRRTMAVGIFDGRAHVMGGERALNNETFPQNEEYDPVTNTWRALEPMPTPRHGAVAATVNGFTYVIGGGPIAGSSFTTVNEAFTLDGS